MAPKQNREKPGTRSGLQDGGEQQGQVEQRGQESPYVDNVLTEVLKIGSTLQTVAADITSIKTKLMELTTVVTDVQERVTEAESHISSVEDVTARLQTEEAKMSKRCEVMWDRIQALENYGKRNNVRIIGLRETVGADGALLNSVHKMMAEGLG